MLSCLTVHEGPMWIISSHKHTEMLTPDLKGIIAKGNEAWGLSSRLGFIYFTIALESAIKFIFSYQRFVSSSGYPLLTWS